MTAVEITKIPDFISNEDCTPWRTYSSLVYLNNDFEGGEIYFPRLGMKLKPTTGLLVIFPSGAEHEHGVKEVTAGQRYNQSTPFTSREWALASQLNCSTSAD